MAQQVPDEELKAIEGEVVKHPEGVTAREIAEALTIEIPHRTLQYRLKLLVEKGRLVKQGERRWAKYRIVEAPAEVKATAGLEAVAMVISKVGDEIRDYLRQPSENRKPVGYNRDFLDAYRPNETFYLPEKERARLAAIGKPNFKGEPAGTYAKHILSRLLIDLSWNSSRLEGNTYSLLDTRRLIEFGQAVEGSDRRDAQMIWNHKDAIEFLVGAADDIGFNRYTYSTFTPFLRTTFSPMKTLWAGCGISVWVSKDRFFIRWRFRNS